jgi:glycine/D-amino acid oxidase-like deaminating enzyme
VAWQRALIESVDEVIGVAEAEGIDAEIVKGGSLRVARTSAQQARLLSDVAEDRRWGADVDMLTADEAARRIRVAGLVSAAFTPDCARIQPAMLVRGLADVVERLGVTIYEGVPVTEIRAGRAETRSGRVDAPIVVRATEGFTPTLARLRRRYLPMNSSMIVTEPMATDVWAEIGWQGRETVGDEAHDFFYAQRTADDRIAIGGRAAPYRYGSRIDRDGVVGMRTVRRLSDLAQRVPSGSRGRDHAWVVRCAWCATRLERSRRVRRCDRPGVGRWLRRTRRDGGEPRRSHAR